jgi:alpha-tubulin suppressor-like RCC1 family protein
LAFSNVPASGTPLQLVIVFRNAADGANYQVTWPASIYWAGSTAQTSLVGPTLVTGANSVTVIALLTTDGGTKWRGWVEASIPGQGLGNTLYSWGSSFYGEGGVVSGDGNYRSSPIQVGGLQSWATVSISSTTSGGILNTGQMYSWGYNSDGQCGINSVTPGPGGVNSPTQVGALTTWAKRSAGTNAAAIKTDGTLWTWGFNSNGELGHNNTTNRSSPVQVGALTTWSQVNAMNRSTIAIKTDGTLWAWGYNNFGQLGQGNTTNRSSPVQVGALTDWATLSNTSGSLSSAAAIKTDGTLWSWGRNNNGQLGLGNTTNYSSPKQVGALTNWASISITQTQTAAVKTDGTLWTWGLGTNGALGHGNTTNYSSPKQVGALTTWSKVAGASSNMIASKTDGTLWTWGANSLGQLGQGNTTNRSSPVQVGAETNWGDVVTSGSTCLAFRTVAAINPA